MGDIVNMNNVMNMAPKVEKRAEKVYVPVTVLFTEDGIMIPREIIWEDGRIYQIDRLTDCRRCASLKVGGIGLRYTCLIRGQQKYLYYEENGKWFLEVDRKR